MVGYRRPEMLFDTEIDERVRRRKRRGKQVRNTCGVMRGWMELLGAP